MAIKLIGRALGQMVRRASIREVPGPLERDELCALSNAGLTERQAATTRYARFRQCAVRSALGACMIMGGHVENGLAKNRPDDILCSEASPLRAGACHRSSPLNRGTLSRIAS